MPQRHERFYEIAGDRTLADIALDVHGTMTGAIERAYGWAFTLGDDIWALQHALETWVPQSVQRFSAVDEAVRCLIVAVLAEATPARPGDGEKAPTTVGAGKGAVAG